MIPLLSRGRTGEDAGGRTASLHRLVIDRTIYVPAWITTLDEICEVTGLDDSLIVLVGEYYLIDVPTDLE